MARRSLSHTLHSLRTPFSRRKHSHDGRSSILDRSSSSSPEGSTHCVTNHHLQQDRKISIDHTVLTKDETASQRNSFNMMEPQFSNSQSLGSFSGPNLSYYAELEAAQQQQQGLNMNIHRAHSEPDFLHVQQQQGPPLEGGCGEGPPLEEGTSSSADFHFSMTASEQQQLAQRYAPRHTACYEHQEHQPPQEQQQPQPHHQQGQGQGAAAALSSSSSPTTSKMSHRSVDPALQARIEGIEIQQSLLGQNHPDVIFALSSLAKLHTRRGNHAEAAAILKESRMRGMMMNSTPTSAPSNIMMRNPQGEPPANIPMEISFAHLS